MGNEKKVDSGLSSPNNGNTYVVRSAYYTPTLDEFHTGFEFEMDAGTGWCNQIFPNPWWNDSGMGGIKTLENCINSRNVRVKQIDKEDLIDLGFSIFGKGNKTFHIKTNTVYMVHLLGSKTVITKDIKLPDKSDANTNVFDGIIKNKSELKSILQKVGCLQS